LRKNEALTGFTENSVPNLKRRSKICSDHFEEICFREGSVRRLKPTAVPTIFRLPSRESTPPTKIPQQKKQSGNIIKVTLSR
jgi:hypothetical protein